MDEKKCQRLLESDLIFDISMTATWALALLTESQIWTDLVMKASGTVADANYPEYKGLVSILANYIEKTREKFKEGGESDKISMEAFLAYLHWISIEQIEKGGENSETYAITLDELKKLLRRVNPTQVDKELNEFLYGDTLKSWRPAGEKA